LDAEAFAAREGVRAERLKWWRWRLEASLASGSVVQRRRSTGGRTSAPNFLEMVLPRVATPVSAAERSAALELQVGRHRVAILPGFDQETLRRLLVVLEGC
jgi:hypothetical protein